jgi:hypothetical protein
MKQSLNQRIDQAIEENNEQEDKERKVPEFVPARTYFSPTDSYETEIGFDNPLVGHAPGRMRGMWQVYEQQQAHVPVTNLKSSGNSNSNFTTAIQGGIPQNPVAPASGWAQVPQMAANIRATGGPVVISGSVAVSSTAATDTVNFAIYRDGMLLGNHESHTIPTSSVSMRAMTVYDNPPIGLHVYAMYWKAGTGTLTAVSNQRNFYVLNLTPQ